VKGGDFKQELEEAGIQNFSLYSISSVVPSLMTDKQLLFIPAKEITSFHNRKVNNVAIVKSKKEIIADSIQNGVNDKKRTRPIKKN